MATIQVSYSGNTDLSQLFIDDRHILTGAGSGSINVGNGDEDHALTWFIRGAPGSNFEISITAPKSAAFSLKGTVDSSTKEAGIQWFRAGGGGGK
jgi:hypothetical protein